MSFTSGDIDFTILTADEQLQTLRLNRLYAAWRQAAGEGSLPPPDFMVSAGHDYVSAILVAVDVEAAEGEAEGGGGAHRFRYRSIGSHIAQHLRFDPVGSYMDQHPESYFAIRALRACTMAVETRRPVHARLAREIDGRAFDIEALLLPVGNTGMVQHLLIAEIFTPA